MLLFPSKYLPVTDTTGLGRVYIYILIFQIRKEEWLNNLARLTKLLSNRGENQTQVFPVLKVLVLSLPRVANHPGQLRAVSI